MAGSTIVFAVILAALFIWNKIPAVNVAIDVSLPDVGAMPRRSSNSIGSKTDCMACGCGPFRRARESHRPRPLLELLGIAPRLLKRGPRGDTGPLGQCFFLLNSRYLIDSSLSIKAHMENKYVALGIGAVIVLQLLFTYAPPLQRLFDNESVPFYVWPWLIAGGFVFFFVIELEKFIIRSSASLRSAVTAVEAGT